VPVAARAALRETARQQARAREPVRQQPEYAPVPALQVQRVAAQLAQQVLPQRVQEAEQQRPEAQLACEGRPLRQHLSIPCRTLLLLPRPLQPVLALELLRVLSPRRPRE